MLVQGKYYRTVWLEGQQVKMIDQTLLPHKFEIITLDDHKQTAEAIKIMKIRGAGAIGATAGYAMAQAALEASGDISDNIDSYISEAAALIRSTRPTAQNLFYAVNRVLEAIKKAGSIDEKKKAAVDEAQKIADEDAAACKAIGEHGQSLIKSGMRIGTHCNAGWLAFVDWGSALSPIYAAKRAGKDVFVYADETRPRGQGASLTAWELQQEGIPFAVIADNATYIHMARGDINMFITGSDRIAANGDVANKIGTYGKAIAARHHGIPFYVAAPTSTIDRDCPSGEAIPIEERSEDEVLFATGRDEQGNVKRVRVTPEGAKARNYAFDVTPASLISGIITEKGIVAASPEGIRSLFE